MFGSPDTPNSLFGEILDWMLAPLVLLWPISIVVTHHVANGIADQPYDKALAENVAVIARLVRVVDGKASIDLSVAAHAILDASRQGDTYFQVRAPGGALLSGSPSVPDVPETDPLALGEAHFRDESIAGEPYRVASQAVEVVKGGAPLVIQLAEPRKRREELASHIISGVLLPQFVVIPVAVVLVYLGLSRGLAPLVRLRRRIAGRRPGDLSPINDRAVPEELKPMVVSFNVLMARLEQNLQAQQRFIADAAHQMRTPLTGLKTQTELVLAEKDPAQMRLSLEQIARSADRAAHLINQLLSLARAESSHDKVHKFQALDLEALARETTQEWVERAMVRRIDLGFEGTGWPLRIEGVPLLLRELLNNLLDNALKYTPEGGRVTVRTLADEQAVLEVEDNGIGVPEEDRERVFERFYRVLGTGADGSGLGLPICSEIAELHRAALALEPGEAGQGTRVLLAFPRRREFALQ